MCRDLGVAGEGYGKGSALALAADAHRLGLRGHALLHLVVAGVHRLHRRGAGVGDRVAVALAHDHVADVAFLPGREGVGVVRVEAFPAVLLAHLAGARVDDELRRRARGLVVAAVLGARAGIGARAHGDAAGLRRAAPDLVRGADVLLRVDRLLLVVAVVVGRLGLRGAGQGEADEHGEHRGDDAGGLHGRNSSGVSGCVLGTGCSKDLALLYHTINNLSIENLL